MRVAFRKKHTALKWVFSVNCLLAAEDIFCFKSITDTASLVFNEVNKLNLTRAPLEYYHRLAAGKHQLYLLTDT